MQTMIGVVELKPRAAEAVRNVGQVHQHGGCRAFLHLGRERFAFAIAHVDGHFLVVNRVFCEMFGASPPLVAGS